MTVVIYGTSVSESTTNSTVWQTKREISGDIEIIGSPADFKIFVQAELSGTLTTEGVQCRVLIDGAERGITTFIPFIANEYTVFTFFGMITYSSGDSGTHSIAVQYRSMDASQAAKIQRVRILVEKH